MNRNISIIWDFDGTIIPDKDSKGNPIDSTSTVIQYILNDDPKNFWKRVKLLIRKSKEDIPSLNGKPSTEQILASDSPVWMHALAQIANQRRVPLNREFFKRSIVPKINLYDNVKECLKKIKNIENENRFQKCNISIHHFIVSAGLKDLIVEIFPKDLITYTFGCKYIVERQDNNKFTNVPVFCMDETMKTRSIFEIAKGTFQDSSKKVNKRILKSDLWSQYSDMIYIGDGDTDIPALAVIRDRGGHGVVVYDKNTFEREKEKVKTKLKNLSLDSRANIITPADFSTKEQLFKFIQEICWQILYSYEAIDFTKPPEEKIITS